MSEPIKNRYEFTILFDVENGNPNGDPDAGNMPRVDPETGYGLVTDVCLKRKIRNCIETICEDKPGYRIYVKEGVPLQRSDKEALEYVGVKEEKDIKKMKTSDPELDRKICDFMCQNFFDIRTFGAVMTRPLSKVPSIVAKFAVLFSWVLPAALILSCHRKSPLPVSPSRRKKMLKTKIPKLAESTSFPMRYIV